MIPRRLPWLVLLAATTALAQPDPGRHAHYLVLTAEWNTAPPFASVDIVYGPREKVGDAEYLWWQLEARPEQRHDGPALFTLRALTSADPLAADGKPLRFARYQLRLPHTNEVLEYRDIHGGAALLPPWRDFDRHFIPRAPGAAGRQNGLPETASYLGHTLTLQWTGANVSWEPWKDVRTLDLDRELLVGTGRNFRDSELKRLPQQPERRDYTYVPFKKEEYATMIEAGINLFLVDDAQTPWITSQPVFFIRSFGGKAFGSYPADLYRSNYIGPVMFMDEPAIIMVGDKNVHNSLRYFSDATTLLMQRVRSRYNSGSSYSAFSLDQALRSAGVNLGAMRLEQHDYPAWETLYFTAHYQLAAGLAGIVHEGRYQLAEFDAAVAKWTAIPRKHTPEEMLRYHYAFLRGAARANNGHWGTSIYCQADPAISPLALTLAYDMGARYAWFWTSDHDHHMPWPEQLDLARQLKAHRLAHPRKSIMHGPRPTLDLAIAIPDGYFLDLGNLWWVRSLDPAGTSDHAQRYARLMRQAHAAMQTAMDRKQDFDLVVDDGREITGYRQVIRIAP